MHTNAANSTANSTTQQLTAAIAIAALCTGEEKVKQRKARKMGRPFYAAQQLFLAGGVNATINDELAAKVCAACGKANKTESLAWLKIAAQMCSGWENAKTAQ